MIYTGKDVDALFKSDDVYAEAKYLEGMVSSDDLTDYIYDSPRAGDMFVKGDFALTIVDAVTGRAGDYMGNDSYENYIIVKVGDQYFKKDGYYNSWDGGGLDGDWYEVENVKKTISVWERKLDY